MVLSGPFAAAPHQPCRFMRPGLLTLSGSSCVAQIIYPSATAPRPTGEPESRAECLWTGTSMRVGES